MFIVAFLIAHWATIAAGYGVAVAASTAIVKLTPTHKDDEVVGKIINVVNVLSTVNPNRK